MRLISLAVLALFALATCKRAESPSGSTDPLAGFDAAAEEKRLQGTWRDRDGCVEQFEGSLFSAWCGSDAPITWRFRVELPSRLSMTTIEADGGAGMTHGSGYALEPDGLRRWHSYSGTKVAAGMVVPTFMPRGLIIAGAERCMFHRALDTFDPAKGFASAGEPTPCAWEDADGGRALTVTIKDGDDLRSVRLVQVGSSLVPENALGGLMVRQ